jgi:medium-chain acyl-[acyl-carrier-protein] hydrolase
MGPRQMVKEYLVHVYETGPEGRVNLWSLFNYMQDIASEHAVKLGFGRDDLLKRNQFWVLSRMYAVIHDLPFWNNEIIVKTWPCGTEKLFALRNYEIKFPDGRDIAAASSSWLIIDRTTKKIQRPGDLLTSYNSDNQVYKTSSRQAVKLSEASSDGQVSPISKVRVSDLDINLHTNNVNYLKWIWDTYDLDFTLTHFPCSAEINYLAESVYDEEIFIRTSKEEENTTFFNHSIFRTNDNKELCRIKIEWKNESINKFPQQ